MISVKKLSPFFTVLSLIVFLGLAANVTNSAASPAQKSLQQSNFCNDVTEIPITECQALEVFYFTTNGANWTNHSDWLTSTTPCSWFGITCSNGSVIKIDLKTNQLSGSIPARLAQLTHLQELFLHENSLTGSIPPELAQLNLTWLWLSDNQLSGTIPTGLGNLTQLMNVDMSRNSLSGPIPTNFGNLTQLEYLGLGQNLFSGAVPSQLGNLTNLMGLYLQGNQLSGPLPIELSNLQNLQSLWLLGNSSLCIPQDTAFQNWLATIQDFQSTASVCTIGATSTATFSLPTSTATKSSQTATPMTDYLAYLPMVMKYPSPTPTATPSFTPTPEFTPTPTATNTPDIDPSAIQVSPSGNDNNGCGTSSSPCRTIQFAVNKASSGGIVFLQAGTYQDNTNPMVEVNKKSVTIQGAGTGQTTIDGGNARRCVYVIASNLFKMSGVTIQNCFANTDPSGDTNVFGAGMMTDRSKIMLQDMLFKNNKVVGKNNSGKGGAGSGGGLAIRNTAVVGTGTSLNNITFDGNQAEGGTGETGGYALGGGLYTYISTVEGDNLTFTNNQAIGGHSSGSGTNNGLADAQGGAAAFQHASNITFGNIEATNNIARGGQASNGKSGGAFGGAFFSEGAASQINSVTLRDANIRDNQALGEAGRDGGHAAGGGIQFDQTNTLIERAYIMNNQSLGGNGSAQQGPAGGGGVYLQNLPGGQMTILIKNSIIANNFAKLGNGGGVGGGGGGMWLQGVTANLEHVTVANNSVQTAPDQGSGWMQGAGILVLNDGAKSASVANISYSIIANHNDSERATVHVKSGNSANLNRTLWAGNSTNTGGDASASDNNALNVDSAGFVSATDYHITGTSAAKDQATGSSNTVDIDNQARDGSPDVGADELN